MTSYDLAHRFFHEPEKRGEYANVNTSFSYYVRDDGSVAWRRYYSYSTCIAEIRKDRKGQDVLVISDDTYSHCTSKHLYELRRANPGLPVVDVPRVGAGFYYWSSLEGTYDFGRKLRTIKELTEKELCRQENRQFVKHFIDLYDKYIEHFSDMDKESKKLRKCAKVRKNIEIMLVKNAELLARKEKIAAMTDEEREANRVKRAAALQRKLEKFMNGTDTLEKIRAAYAMSYRMQYSRSGNEVTKVLRDYRNHLQSQKDEQGRYLSYVWIEGDHAKTSQHCQAPIADVERLLRLWKHRQNMVGQHAGMYTVLENDQNHVKIGCHVIPAWNIELLCNKLNVA